MKTEHMREFLELAETKNYSSAAKNLFISQPTLSRRIQAIEEELGYNNLNFKLISISEEFAKAKGYNNV